MRIAADKINGVQQILERKQAELVLVLRERGGIAIERGADPMDGIQSASERDLAIGNVDRESTLLRDLKAALRRMREGTFGICIECESEIGAKRLAAVPWAPRCIECQNAADRVDREQGCTNEKLAPAA